MLLNNMKIRSLLYLFLILISMKGYGQNCSLSVSLSRSEPTICSGNSLILTAITTAGTAPYKFVWSTGQTGNAIVVNKAGTYSVTVTDNTPGCQPVINSIAVNTSLTPDAPTAKGAVICPNSVTTLTATAPGGTYQWYDATGNFLATGASYTTPPVTSSTVFYVQTTSGGCTSNRTPVNVNITGKPTVVGATVCQGNVSTLLASGGDTFAWYATSSATGTPLSTEADFTTPVLTTTTTYFVVVTSNGCTSNPTPVTATIIPKPQPPVITNQTVCSGATANLHAGAPAGIINWYSVPSGGVPLISSPDYTTPALTTNTTYYVENDINDCVSKRVPVTVTVNPQPDPPVSQTDSVCYQTSAVLTAGTHTNLTYKWYDAANGGNLLATGATYTTPALLVSTTYFLQLINGGCESTRSPVNVIVKPLLSPPTASGVIICPDGAATLTATSAGGICQWFDAAAGGNLISSQNSFNVPPLKTTTTYYVQRTLSGCTSPRSAVTVTVLEVPQSPAATGTSVCEGNSAVLSASGPTDTYAWYSSLTGGVLLSTAQVFVTPNLNTSTTYYVETSNANGCASVRTPVTVTVYPTPAAPVAGNVSTCMNTAATLTARASSGVLQWYAEAAGGNMLATGNTFVTPVLKAATTYYVQNTIGECTGPRTVVTVSLISLIDPQFIYPSGSECVSGPNPKPEILNPSGGKFTAAPAGLVFVNAATGEINVAASPPGTYVISFTGNDQCPHTTTAKFSIITTANAHFTYTGPYCQDGINPFPEFLSGATNGSFSATPAGLTFVSTSTGQINLSNSKPGTYVVTNTITPSGGCTSSTASTTVVINQKVTVSAGPPQTVLQGTPVQLAGSISGAGITTGRWSGGNGSFSNASSLNTTYTPLAGEINVNLTLLSDNPAAPCGQEADIVAIHFIPPPAAPAVLGTTICDGTNTTLAATAPGGVYEWFSTATGTYAMATGATFTTLWLTKTTTFYVQTTVNGYTSARKPVIVTVVPEPVAPAAASQQICSGSVAVLKASGSSGVYSWYDAPSGGNLLSTDDSFTTPALQFNNSYYVEAKSNNCVSPRTKVDVSVSTEPYVTSSSKAMICSGNPMNYLIQANVAAATFSWSRASVSGISNAPINGQTSATISETLVNTSQNPENVTYTIIPVFGSCTGSAFNYVVTVNPQPVVTGPQAAGICNANTDNYQIQFNTPVANFTWSRAAVPGISNAAVAGQNSNIIKEILFNTSNAPVVVPYIVNCQTTTCDGTPFTINMTVNPTATITSPTVGAICSGTVQNYVITSSIPKSTYSWSRTAVNNISNAAVANQTSENINETLINTGTSAVNVVYSIIPQAYGCNGNYFNYTVTVNPTAKAPVANSNSPICLGSTIQLRTTPVPNATYLWTGPNGQTWSTQNVDIPDATAAMAGIYNLVVTNKQGCPSPGSEDTVKVNAPGIAVAGPDQKVCVTVPYVSLAGSIAGGPASGIWTTAGTGTFSESNALTSKYTPSAADKAAGAVVLTLSSASTDNCSISSSSMTVNFGPVAGVIAGADQEVCSQATSVKLAGSMLTPLSVQWTTSGSGSFNNDTQADATYLPSAADIKSGQVTLKLSVINGGPCYTQYDTTELKFEGPPKLSSGGIVYVLKNKTTMLTPVVNENDLTYLWSPNIDISDVNVKNPVITGDVDRFYTLTVTDSRGCQTTDTTFIKVSPEINIPNTFTPNGDGINDTWELVGLTAYIQGTVDIFNRYGQKVFHSLGYPKPWDGTYNGSPLPSGVYYYIIDTKFNSLKFAGDVMIVR